MGAGAPFQTAKATALASVLDVESTCTKRSSRAKKAGRIEARKARTQGQLGFPWVGTEKRHFGVGCHWRFGAMSRRTPDASPTRKPRRVGASTASGSNHSSRGLRVGLASGLSVHGREAPESQVSVGERTAEFRNLGIYIPNCNKGPQRNKGSRSAVVGNVRSRSADALPRLRHFSALSGIKDCPE